LVSRRALDGALAPPLIRNSFGDGAEVPPRGELGKKGAGALGRRRFRDCTLDGRWRRGRVAGLCLGRGSGVAGYAGRQERVRGGIVIAQKVVVEPMAEQALASFERRG
jgi:hypothetical protein